MPNSLDAAHTPAVNHSTHRLAGFTATHATSAPSFGSAAIDHGNETLATSATQKPAAARLALADDVRQAVPTTNAPAAVRGGPNAQGNLALLNWVLDAHGNYVTADPNNDNYQITYSPTTGTYDFSNPYAKQSFAGSGGAAYTVADAASGFASKFGLSGGAVGSNLPAAYISPNTGTATGSSSSTSSPFNTLASLLSTMAGTTPAATTVPDNSPGTSVPTTSGPSMVIPLMLILLAVGVGYWWYTKHKKHAPAHA